MPKRKTPSNGQKTKRNKKENIDDYVSASQIHNYMLNDPVLDWINLTHKLKKDEFFNFITQRGIEFEKEILKDFEEQYKVVKIENDENKYTNTEKAISDNAEIIYQGSMYDDELEVRGSPDFIMRTDIMAEMFPNCQLPRTKYVILDVKYTTVHLKTHNDYVKDIGRMVANKGQLLIYNKLLGNLLGEIPEVCYVLGRRYQRNDTFIKEVIGHIDREYETKALEAIKWVHNVKKNAAKWYGEFMKNGILPVNELYPNMCNKHCTGNEYEKKKKIAEDVGEISLIWNCGVKQREAAHNNGIFSIYDRKLTASKMGIPTSSTRRNLINEIISFNNNKKEPLVVPDMIEDNTNEWHLPLPVEFFLDFEEFNDIFVPDGLVFMIGLGVSITKTKEKKEWIYYNIRVPNLSKDAEKKAFQEMYSVMDEYIQKYRQEDANVYHWGQIEETILKRVQERHGLKIPEHLYLMDFCDYFQQQRILVKGSYNFGLKSIGRKMIEHDLIRIDDWENLDNGLDAMVKAYKIYTEPVVDSRKRVNKKIDNDSDSDSDSDDDDADMSDVSIVPTNYMREIINYNEKDCRMIEKIITYLRKKHTLSNAFFDILNSLINIDGLDFDGM